jgi:hypothetical protein
MGTAEFLAKRGNQRFQSGRGLDGMVLDQIFIDKAFGKDINRPQLEIMLRFARIGDTAASDYIRVQTSCHLPRRAGKAVGVVADIA